MNIEDNYSFMFKKVGRGLARDTFPLESNYLYYIIYKNFTVKN